MLNGIDVSSNQPANICDIVPYDFAIVKVSGNPQQYAWNYVNPYWRQQAVSVLSSHRCLGLYHFTWGKDAATEADFFISEASDHIGKAMLVIDYEGEAIALGREWLRAFIKRIKQRAGVNPVVYASSAVIIEQDLTGLCAEENCAIWSANYWMGYQNVYGYDSGSCRMDIAQSAMWQFTPCGILDGYEYALDLNHFFGDAAAWRAYATGNASADVPDNTPSKTVEQLAEEVINGLWGNGDDRKNRLSVAGYEPEAVQKRVNEKLAPAVRTYTVVSGDTLSGIGARLGVDWRSIAEENGIGSPYTIYPGDQLTY